MTIQEILEAHKISAFAGSDTACACDRTWRTNTDYRAHLAEVLEQHMQEREVALLSSVAEEAIEKYADKPYSPGHVIRLLLTRANQIRTEPTNGR